MKEVSHMKLFVGFIAMPVVLVIIMHIIAMFNHIQLAMRAAGL